MYNTYLNGIKFSFGIYIRLSKEDKEKNESDSESVINQKELLRCYANNNNLNLFKAYADDVYSEIDFERHGFYNMLENQNIIKYKMKYKVNALPDYTKKLLDLSKQKKELIYILVDRIVIDKGRNLARNPYGRKGKKLDY